VMNRPLRDVRKGDSTICARGGREAGSVGPVRIGASSGRDIPGGGNADGRHEARGFRRLSPTAEGPPTRAHVVGFRPHAGAFRGGPDPSAGAAQASLRAPTRDRRTPRPPTAFPLPSIPFLSSVPIMPDP